MREREPVIPGEYPWKHTEPQKRGPRDGKYGEDLHKECFTCPKKDCTVEFTSRCSIIRRNKNAGSI